MSVFGGAPRQLILDIDSHLVLRRMDADLLMSDTRRIEATSFRRSTSPTKTEATIKCFTPARKSLGAGVVAGRRADRVASIRRLGARKVVLGWIDLSSKKLNTIAAPADITPRIQFTVINLVAARQPASAGALSQAAHRSHPDRDCGGTLRRVLSIDQRRQFLQ